MTIEEFIEQRLAEDEQIARSAIDPDRPDAGGGTRSRAVAEHIALHDPASTLRRVEAIRRLLRRHEDAERDSVLSERDAGFEAGLYAALEALAGIYPEDTDETEKS